MSLRSGFLNSPTAPSLQKSSLPSTDEIHSGDYRWLKLAFLFISFGYMLPWTALGSLISYFKYKYSAHFYLKIYCAYYLPGLPVAALQYLYDEKLDNRFGSRYMYTQRGSISFICICITLYSMLWASDESTIILLFMVLGIFGWLLHGTASMLASLFPSVIITYLQIGFRCPEIYAIIADSVLGLDRAANSENLSIFYKTSVFVILLSLCCWIVVVNSKTAIFYFNEKDSLAVIEASMDSSNTNIRPERKVSFSLPDSDSYMVFQNESEELNEDDSLYSDDHSHANLTPFEDRLDASMGNINIFRSYICFLYCPAKYLGSVMISRSKQLLKENKVFIAVCPVALALMITIWSSIFHASFYAYVDSPGGHNIEQALYFTRLFADLVGRPLTFLPRPSFLLTGQDLLTVSIVRAFLMIVFFLYTFCPLIPRADMFVIFFVAVYSTTSGYLSVLCYEYAAAKVHTYAQRANAANILNMSFQIAAFIAVLMSVAIMLLFLVKETV